MFIAFMHHWLIGTMFPELHTRTIIHAMVK